MTGKELIVYILQNDLEDEEIFKDGVFIGFMTVEQAAEKFEVGMSTIYAWVFLGDLPSIHTGGKVYIPVFAEDPRNNFAGSDY